MDIEVHRAGRTFYSHAITLLNVPDRELDRFLQTPGWQAAVGAKFMGLPEAQDLRLAATPATDRPASQPAELTSQDLDELLSLQGQVSDAEIMTELLKRRAERQHEGESVSAVPLADRLQEMSGVQGEVWLAAGNELLDALLPRLSEGVKEIPSDSARDEDISGLDRLGVARLSLVPDFPILTATYGFSRIDFTPNRARLNAFPADRAHGGRTPIYVDEVGADAIILTLDHARVLRWLAANGRTVAVPGGSDRDVAERAYFVSLLTGVSLRETIPSGEFDSRMVFGLVHSLSHIAIRQAALLCGLDRTSLSEYLLPRALSFAIYCNHRFGATIGALTALFEGSVADWFGLIENQPRCVYDPVCADRGANCHACAHLPETSCRFFNLNLSRAFLFGGEDAVLGDLGVGYFDRRLD
jgi:hypothetical protein